jgi:hypothetical protein
MRPLVSVIVVGAGLLLAAATVSAHHSASAQYDTTPAVIKGTITKTELTNPHAFIYVDVKKPDGSTENWRIDAGTPNTLRQALVKDSLSVNTEITVQGYRAMNGGTVAIARQVTLPDGRDVFLGAQDPCKVNPSLPVCPPPK